tara:strand:+ start:127 stop:381 length:255 start_codon:yes stop_codon:yes gene_type:complete
MVPMCTEYDSYHLCQNVFWRLYKFETIVRLRLFEKKLKNIQRGGNNAGNNVKNTRGHMVSRIFFGIPTMQMMLYNGLQRTMSYQ